MRTRPILSSALRSALRDAVLLQIPLVLLAGLAADFGVLLFCSLKSSAAFWLMAAVIAVRQPQTNSAWDLGLIRFGYLALLPLFVVLESQSSLWRNGW